VPLRLLAVTFDVDDPAAVAAFWAQTLGREVVDDGSGTLLPGGPTQVGLRFLGSPDEGSADLHLHLHLTSTSPEDQQATVDRSLQLGAAHLDVGQTPEEGHVVLADPGGHPFCVIEPGNRFLAGTGHLGEVGCDGSRAVGVFWSEALGWPLVWDENEETAIQSPAGGTKLAWGGPPVSTWPGRNRQRFELVADDAEAELQRLVSLGATRVTDRPGEHELADPDGNEFVVRSSGDRPDS